MENQNLKTEIFSCYETVIFVNNEASSPFVDSNIGRHGASRVIYECDRMP